MSINVVPFGPVDGCSFQHQLPQKLYGTQQRAHEVASLLQLAGIEHFPEITLVESHIPAEKYIVKSSQM